MRTWLGVSMAWLWGGLIVWGAAAPCLAQSPATSVHDAELFERQTDVIYSRKFGTALTLDVFTPTQKRNGRGLIFVVSGGWTSFHEAINPGPIREFVNRGYTVFPVVHGSQPKFTIPEILDDLHRSVRYVRHHAAKYGIDPDRIGIYGGSAGGHLSLMQGTAGQPGNPEAVDPVDRHSSRVQAVACFYPPTDFLNYGKPGESALGEGVLVNFKAPFQFRELDAQRNTWVAVTEEQRIREIGRRISPVYHVSPDDAPALLIHGDADQLVPLQQSERIVAAYRDQKVPVELIIKPGQAHGWPKLNDDLVHFADWFDRHLFEPLPSR